MDDIFRKKIVYVDDINYSLRTVKDRLKEHYEIFPVQMVSKMFEILDHVKPDLILLDINMPDIDGYGAIERLKANNKYAHIPVIFLTGKIDKESVVKGLSLGASDYVTKPFFDEHLIDRINYHLYPEKRKAPLHNDEGVGKKSILAVDDVPSMLRAIHYALRDKYRVYMLSDPTEIQDFLKKTTPDMFLLDYNMPVFDGFNLISIIREIPKHKETPIIFLTSEKSSYHVNAAIQFGVCDYIVKPFNTHDLRKKIANHFKSAK